MEAGGFSCVVCGGRPLAGYPGKALSWNPAGSCGCREFGVSVGCSTNKPFPLFKRGEEDRQGEERGRRDARADLSANSKDALRRDRAPTTHPGDQQGRDLPGQAPAWTQPRAPQIGDRRLGCVLPILLLAAGSCGCSENPLDGCAVY